MTKKRERITPIVADETTINIAQPQAPLPSIEEVTSTLTEVTKIPTETPKTNLGRPIKKEAEGREKITTRLDQKTLMTLKMKAIQKRITLADLINLILIENMDNY